MLLDCAHGAGEALLGKLGGDDLDAVVLRHYHPEMLADVLPVAREYRPRLLFVPDEARSIFTGRGELSQTSIVGVREGTRAVVQRLRFAFGPASHGCPGVSVRIETPDAAVGYLGDTGNVDGLAAFAQGVRLLIAHTLLLDRESEGPRESNLTAGDAGRLARAAGAGRLALAHVPFYPDADAAVDEARGAFGGEVVVLRQGEALQI